MLFKLAYEELHNSLLFEGMNLYEDHWAYLKLQCRPRSQTHNLFEQFSRLTCSDYSAVRCTLDHPTNTSPCIRKHFWKTLENVSNILKQMPFLQIHTINIMHSTAIRKLVNKNLHVVSMSSNQ